MLRALTQLFSSPPQPVAVTQVSLAATPSSVVGLAAAADPVLLRGVPPRLPADADLFLRVPEHPDPIAVQRHACMRDSLYFRTMLQTGAPWEEARAQEIDCPEVDGEVAQQLAAYMAGGSLRLRADNLVPVFQLADRWEMPELIARCLEEVPQLASAQNMEPLLQAAEMAGLEELKQRLHDTAWLWNLPQAGGKPKTAIASARLQCLTGTRYAVQLRWHAPRALQVGHDTSPVLRLGPLNVSVTRRITAAGGAPERALYQLNLHLRQDHLPAQQTVFDANDVVRVEFSLDGSPVPPPPPSPPPPAPKMVRRRGANKSVPAKCSWRDPQRPSAAPPPPRAQGGRAQVPHELAVPSGRYGMELRRQNVDTRLQVDLLDLPLQGAVLREGSLFEPDRDQHLVLNFELNALPVPMPGCLPKL